MIQSGDVVLPSLKIKYYPNSSLVQLWFTAKTDSYMKEFAVYINWSHSKQELTEEGVLF